MAWASSSSKFFSARVLRGQRKRFRFNVDEQSAEHADRHVELGRLGPFEIGEKSPDPGLEMSFEDALVAFFRGAEAAVDEPGHHFAQDGHMILRLDIAVAAL